MDDDSVDQLTFGDDRTAAHLDRILAARADDREAELARACREDPQLASQLRQRLAALESFGLLDEHDEADELPEQIGEYRVLGLLGHGGMGRVYRAMQESLGREVAIKLMRRDAAFDAQRRQRFRREAETIARLDHPNIVPLFGSGEASGVPWIVMPIVTGVSFASLIRTLGERRASLRAGDLLECGVGAAVVARAGGHAAAWDRAAIALATPIAAALAHAHARGIVHRDVKPSNVVISDDGRPMLLDFGLASLADGIELTQDGAMLGSVPYMAPEQIEGHAAAPTLDVFAFGAMLFELLVFEPAFDRRSMQASVHAILHDDPTPLRQLDRRIDRDIAAIVARCLEKPPTRRYPDAAALLQDLEAVLDGRPVLARPLSWAQRAARMIRRRPALFVSVVAISLATVTIAGTFGYLAGRANELEVGRATIEQTTREDDLSAMFVELVRGDRRRAALLLEPILAKWPDDQIARLADAALAGRAFATPSSAADAAYAVTLRAALGEVLPHDAAGWSELLSAARTAVVTAARPRALLHVGLAIAAARADDVAAATEAAAGLGELWPESAHCAYWAGYAMLGIDPERAASSLRRAIQLAPDFGPAHADLGVAELRCGRADAALVALQRAVTLAPTDARSHIDLGITRRQLGDADGAVEALSEACRLAPELPGAHYNLGVALAATDPAAAIESFATTVRLAPEYERAWHNLGTLRLRAGEVAAAIAAFERATALRPDWLEAHRALGAAHAQNGDAARAADVYRRVVELAPTDRAAHDYLCQLLEHLGDTDRLRAERSRFAAIEER